MLVYLYMYVCTRMYIIICTNFFSKSHFLEVDSVSQMFLHGSSFISRITSIADRFSDTFFA